MRSTCFPRRGLKPRPGLVKVAYRGGVSVWEQYEVSRAGCKPDAPSNCTTTDGLDCRIEAEQGREVGIIVLLQYPSGHRVKSLKEGNTQYGARM